MLQQEVGLALWVWQQLPRSLSARLVGSLGFRTLPRALLTALASSMLQVRGAQPCSGDTLAHVCCCFYLFPFTPNIEKLSVRL